MTKIIVTLAITLTFSLGLFASRSNADGCGVAILYCAPNFSGSVKVTAVAVSSWSSIAVGDSCSSALSTLIDDWYSIEDVEAGGVSQVIYYLTKSCNPS
jgi:hypothetical protein